MTRIISGMAGGRRLQAPSGAGTRPTSDRVREALFSTLESGFGSLDRAAFLDLFAGSGAIGLEALSRGARRAVMVERDRRASAVITKNVETLGLAGATVVTTNAHRFVESVPPEPYDVIFLDPPYQVDADTIGSLLTQVTAPRWWSPGGWVVVERPSRGDGFTWPDSVEPGRQNRYGETMLWYGRCHA